MNLIDQLNREEMERITALRQIPEFSPGDTLRVHTRIVEGDRTRVQAFEGVCIAVKGRGISRGFLVRRVSFGEGVERLFMFYSPLIEKVEVLRRGKVRRARLYYLRKLHGKAARISEATNARARRLNAEQRVAAVATKKKS